jgi:hypothetical protein
VRERTDPNHEPVIQAEFAKGRFEEISVKNMAESEVLGELIILNKAEVALCTIRTARCMLRCAWVLMPQNITPKPWS